jgi:type I restriction enzyme S subunit
MKTLDDFIKIEVAEKALKEVEVQGPYDLPKGWKWVKLKEILKEDRQSVNPQEYPDKEFFLVTMDCIESNSGKLLKKVKCLGKEIKSMKYKFDTKHILYGKLRPYLNKVYVPEEEGTCTTEFIPFIVTKALREYVAYYLRRKETVNFAMSHITGTRQPRVIINTFLEYPIPLPPLEEQKRIVSRLDQLVSKAEEAKRLRKLAKEEAEKIMRAALNKVFSKAEEEGWKWIKLKEIAKIIGGGTPRRNNPKYWNGDIPWLSPSELIDGKINYITDTKEKITRLGLERSNAQLIPINSVLLTCTASVGKVAINKVEITTNQQFNSFVLDSSKIIPEFLAYYFLYSKQEIQKLGGETTFRFIRKELIGCFKVPLPSVKEQRRIVTYLNNLSETIESLNKLQQKTEEELEKLVPAILDKAFKGEV